jgi:site-specific DNA recombinase
MTTVAVYTRLSADPTGAQTATSRQLSGCRSFADLRDWEIRTVYEDVDLSAYQRGVVRPDYQQMLDDIRHRRVDGILAWKLDRLVRRPAEFERLWSLCEDSGVFLASAMEPLDTSTDMGLALVRVLVAFASLESATIGVRLRAKFKERAESGVPHNPGRVFGYQKGWQQIDRREAAHIRRAAKDVLDGVPLHRIVTRWNAAGVKPLRADYWTSNSLKQILVSHRLTADRVYRGEVIGPGNWPPILDDDTGRRLRQLLSDPGRRTSFPGPERELLSGLVTCGRCGTTLVAQTEMSTKRGMFVCPAPPRGCSGISVGREPATRAAVTTVLGRFATHRLRGLHEHAERDVPHRVLAARSTRLIGEAWTASSLSEQRAMVRTMVEAVRIDRQGKGGCKFDPNRVVVEWRRPDRRWVSVSEAVAELSLSRAAVYRLIQAGDIAAEKVGGAWLIRLGG